MPHDGPNHGRVGPEVETKRVSCISELFSSLYSVIEARLSCLTLKVNSHKPFIDLSY